MTKNYNGRSSNKFKNGSNVHNGASRSQSGLPSYGQRPKRSAPQKSFGQSVADALFGPGPKVNTHGPGKRKKR